MIDSAMLRRLMVQCGMENYVIDDAALRLARACFIEGKREERQECAELIEPTNPPNDWTEYEKVRARCAADIRARKDQA